MTRIPDNWLRQTLRSIVDYKDTELAIEEAAQAIHDYYLKHEQAAVVAAINQATQAYHYNMPIKSVRTRNTAFKLYAVKFMNSKLKERRERMLAETRTAIRERGGRG